MTTSLAAAAASDWQRPFPAVNLPAAVDSLRLQSAALHAAADAIVITDRQGLIVWTNPAFTALTGYLPGEAWGVNPRDLVRSGQNDSRTYDELWQTIESGKTWQGELINRRKDGSTYPERQTITPVLNVAGEITHFVAIKQDLTEHRRAEAKLREAETRHRILFEHSPDGIVVIDAATTRFLDFNEAAHQQLGYTREEFGRLTIADIEATESADQIHQRIAKVQSLGRDDFETSHRQRNGEIRHVLVTAQFTRFEGRPVYHGVWRDITAHKAAERRLREQSDILSHSHEGVMIVDLSNQVTFWNHGAEKIFGWTAEEAKTRLPEQLLGIENPAGVALIRTGVERAGHWSGEIAGRSRDGRNIIIDYRITLVRDETGTPRARLAFLSDSTEKKQLEEKFLRTQRLESVGVLAAGIAHDLNNVLAPIVVAVPMLRASLQDPGDQHILSMLEKSAARGAGLVRQILGFTRGTMGEFQTTQVRHLVLDLQSLMTETFPKSIQIKTDVPSELWPVNGDATQIHQILLNLCVNARDAMPQGGTLRVSATNLDSEAASAKIPAAPSGSWLMLEVSDTGTGIAPEILERIWTPFFTTKGVGKGTGLGLSTVRGIVAGHHGFVELDSRVGEGTTFRIFLPAIAEAGPACLPPPESGGIPRGQGQLILVVDDDPSIRTVISATLKHHGYLVMNARDGGEALMLCSVRLAEIALIVTDVDMPRLGGMALARAALKLRPDIRLLAMSGLSGQEGESSDVPAVRELVHAFLHKPFGAEDLLRTVHRLLQTTFDDGLSP